jgi:hypothetical protein
MEEKVTVTFECETLAHPITFTFTPDKDGLLDVAYKVPKLFRNDPDSTLGFTLSAFQVGIAHLAELQKQEDGRE